MVKYITRWQRVILFLTVFEHGSLSFIYERRICTMRKKAAKIADEVVAIIAGLAATEVEGVDSMAGNITNELVGKLGMKNLSKGVKVEVTEEHVSVDLSLNIRYGYNIPAVSEQVQDKVSAAIENMTGLTVLDVNIKIAGVNMEEGK